MNLTQSDLRSLLLTQNTKQNGPYLLNGFRSVPFRSVGANSGLPVNAVVRVAIHSRSTLYNLPNSPCMKSRSVKGGWAREMGPSPECFQSMNSASNFERPLQFQNHCSNAHPRSHLHPHSHLLKILPRLHPRPLETAVTRHVQSVNSFSGKPSCSTLLFLMDCS